MAPEVRDGKQYGPKADIYAIGIIYFELLNKMKTTHERNRYNYWKNFLGSSRN